MLSRVTGYKIEAAVFLSGALVMVFEIVGSRIVSPFLGASTYIWTSLIGVILGALSVGYWLGGRMADKGPRESVLASVLFIAGGLVSVTILLKDAVLFFASELPVGLEIRSIVAAILLFAPASVAFGFVTPYAIRLRIASIEDAGKTVGRLYSLSTVGSIVGTFAGGFFLIPFVGSVRTLYLIAGLLFLLGMTVAAVRTSTVRVASVIVFVLGIAVSEGSRYAVASMGMLEDIDTEYARVQVLQVTDPKTQRQMRAIATDPFFWQSAIYTDTGESAFQYGNFYDLLPVVKPNFSRTLTIGGAGYIFPSRYVRTYPNAKIDVAEIDPQMTEIARKYFNLAEDQRLRIYHEDGCAFLNRSPSCVYDAVLIDAFASMFSTPFQLTTVESVRHIDRVLTPDGVVMMNVGSAIAGPSSGFLHAELATYKAVFPFVYIFKVDPKHADEDLQNVVVLACKAECLGSLGSLGSLEGRERENAGRIGSLLERRYELPPLDKPMLTDDLAPVEYYGSVAVRGIRR